MTDLGQIMITEVIDGRIVASALSPETTTILSKLGSGPLDGRIKRLAEERDELQDNVKRLKVDLQKAEQDIKAFQANVSRTFTFL